MPDTPGAAVRRVVPSERSERIRYAVRDVLLVAEEARRAGRELLHLNIGDPALFDFPVPAHLVEAVERAMRAGRNGYADSFGEGEALEAIRRDAERKGIRSVRSVFVTSGSSEAIEVALAALVNPGDRVLTPCPGYPLYDAVLAKLDVENVPYFLEEGNGWQPDLDDVARRIDGRTRAIVLINPNNPTGSVASRENLTGLLALAQRHGVVVFADEIYDRLVLDEGTPHVSIAALAPDHPVVTFNGLSKAYLVPGWRLGWGVVSGSAAAVGEYVAALGKFLRARLSANHPEQYAVRPALEGPQQHLVEARAKLRRRRDLCVARLNAIPRVRCVPPRAAFYAFPSLDVRTPDEELVRDLIRDTGVVVVHGSGFGQRPGSRQLRLVFLPDEETLARAIDRIAAHAEGWK